MLATNLVRLHNLTRLLVILRSAPCIMQSVRVNVDHCPEYTQSSALYIGNSNVTGNIRCPRLKPFLWFAHHLSLQHCGSTAIFIPESVDPGAYLSRPYSGHYSRPYLYWDTYLFTMTACLESLEMSVNFTTIMPMPMTMAVAATLAVTLCVK